MSRFLFVYIVECSDGPYYTGVTNNVARRLSEHNEGIDPKSYTYNKRPVKLLFSERFGEHHQAINFEKQVKGWSRKKKQALIDGNWEVLKELSNEKNTAKEEKRNKDNVSC